MSETNATDPSHKRVDQARHKTDKVQRDLQVAGAELNLTNTALKHGIPQQVVRDDVARALMQNHAIEEKVEEAVEELAEVTELLDKEQAHRKSARP